MVVFHAMGGYYLHSFVYLSTFPSFFSRTEEKGRGWGIAPRSACLTGSACSPGLGWVGLDGTGRGLLSRLNIRRCRLAWLLGWMDWGGLLNFWTFGVCVFVGAGGLDSPSEGWSRQYFLGFWWSGRQ